MTSNDISVSALLCAGAAGYLGMKLAKESNVKLVRESNIPFISPEQYNNLMSQPDVVEFSFAASTFEPPSLSLVRKAPIFHEAIVATIGAVFGAAVGFAVAKWTHS